MINFSFRTLQLAVGQSAQLTNLTVQCDENGKLPFFNQKIRFRKSNSVQVVREIFGENSNFFKHKNFLGISNYNWAS